MLHWQITERERVAANRIARRGQLIDTLIAVLIGLGIGLIVLGLSLRYL